MAIDGYGKVWILQDCRKMDFFCVEKLGVLDSTNTRVYAGTPDVFWIMLLFHFCFLPKIPN